MTRFGPMTDAGAASPAAPPSRLKQLRNANRDTPAGPSGLLLTVIPASSGRPTTAFGGVCPGTSQARSSSNKLGINWSAMQAGQRPQASDLRVCSPDWTRTSNLPINSRLLCQLSYRGMLRVEL